MNNQKVVLILGAGSTFAEVEKQSKIHQPPLDKKFFSQAKSIGYKDVYKIISYIKDNYHSDVIKTDDDSLEKIMTILYSDIFDPNLQSDALKVFRDLIFLFNKILAETTNKIEPNYQRILYRVILKYLKKETNPENITIITYNQDLHVEKIIELLSKSQKWKEYEIFQFPYCYNIDVEKQFITHPSKSKKDLFKIFKTKKQKKGISILKLHGSLNWYSAHNSSNLQPKNMFNPTRNIRITRRKTISPKMMLEGRRRRLYTIPVVVPPVNHKSSIIHNKIKKIWNLAQDNIKAANEIIIYGYSCPEMDFESSNLIKRSLLDNSKDKKISIIDPDSSALKRYVDLFKPEKIYYYKNVKHFL